MKAWIWTYLLFLRCMLKVVFGVTAFACGLVLLSHGLLATLVSAETMKLIASSIPFCVFLACLVGLSSPVGSNISWLQTLPFSKRRLVVLFFALQVTLVSLALVSSGLVALLGAFTLLGLDWPRLYPALLVIWLELSKPNPEVLAISNLATVVTFSNFLLWFLFKAPLSQVMQRTFQTMQTYQTATSLKGRVLPFAGLFALVFAGAVTHEYWSTPFGSSVIVSFGLLGILAFSWSRVLSLGRAISKGVYALCFGLAAIEMIGLYAIAIHRRNAPDFPTRAKSIVFLGPLAGALESKELARLIEEGDSGFQATNALGEKYLRFFNGGKRLNARNGGLDVKRALASTNNVSSLYTIRNLFDPKTFELEELKAVLTSLKNSDGYWDWKFAVLPLTEAKLSPPEVVTLLFSQDELENRYALARARRDRRREYGDAIVENFGNYSEETAVFALGTLSILAGRSVSLKELKLILEGRFLFSLYEADCAGFKKIPLEDFKGDLAQWNVCIRTIAGDLKPHEASLLENRGWYTRDMRTPYLK